MTLACEDANSKLVEVVSSGSRTKLLPYTNFYIEVLTLFWTKLLHVEVLTNFRIKLLYIEVLTTFPDKLLPSLNL